MPSSTPGSPATPDEPAVDIAAALDPPEDATGPLDGPRVEVIDPDAPDPQAPDPQTLAISDRARDEDRGVEEDPAGPDTAQDPPAGSGVPTEPVTGPGPLHLSYVATSHVGLVRKNNQDSGYASATMLVVADGMGGAAAGDLASAVAVDAVGRADGAREGQAMIDNLAEAIGRANDKIADLVADDHTLEGMGTTVSGAMFDGRQLGICHIGDSRIYRWHDERLERLTHDHSWVQSLVDDGKITEEEAAYHPHRSLLLKVLNGHPNNHPDVQLLDLAVGDRIVLCSDGLCGFVDDDLIAEIVAQDEPATVLNDLLEAALQAGGLDNITVIVADVVEAEQPAAPPLVLGAATEQEIPQPRPINVDLGDSELDDQDDTAVVPTAPRPVDEDDAEEQRYAMRPPPRRRWIRRAVGLLAAVLVLAALVGGGWAWGRTQFYVSDAGPDVAIYQGVPLEVGGLGLSQVYEVQQVKLDDLPLYYQTMVRGSISANSLDQARQTVTELEAAAQACRDKRARAAEPPASPASPSSAPSEQATEGTPAPAPSTSPSTRVPC